MGFLNCFDFNIYILQVRIVVVVHSSQGHTPLKVRLTHLEVAYYVEHSEQSVGSRVLGRKCIVRC